MWTLIGSLADVGQPNAVNVYVKEKALALLVEREAWRRRFSLAGFSNLAPAPEPTPEPENVVYAEAASEPAPAPEADTSVLNELLGPEDGIDNDDDDDDDDWSIL